MSHFTSTSSGSHLRTVLLFCQQLFSSTLLLILDKSIGNIVTRSIRGHRTQSHPLDSLSCTFFVQRTGWLKPLRFRSSYHSASREARGKNLRAFKGLATPSSSVFLTPFLHTSLQLWPAKSFQGSSPTQQWAPPLLNRCLSQLDQREDLTEKANWSCSFSSAPGKGHMKYFWYTYDGISRELAASKYSCLYVPVPSPSTKIAKRGWKWKGIEVKRRPTQWLNWDLNAASFPTSAAALTAPRQGRLQVFC